MPTSPRFLLRRAEPLHRCRDLPKGVHIRHLVVNAPKAVGGVEKGHPRLGGGVAVPLGVPDVQGLFQAVAFRQQGDVLPLGLAGAAGVFIVPEEPPQAVGLEEGLDVPVLAVADEKEGTAGGDSRSSVPSTPL